MLIWPTNSVSPLWSAHSSNDSNHNEHTTMQFHVKDSISYVLAVPEIQVRKLQFCRQTSICPKGLMADPGFSYPLRVIYLRTIHENFSEVREVSCCSSVEFTHIVFPIGEHRGTTLRIIQETMASRNIGCRNFTTSQDHHLIGQDPGPY